MPDELSEKQKVLKLARELESLGVNVRGFLEQAVDGEKRANFRARLFALESAGIIRPHDYERRRLRHFADELRERGESSFVLFAPSLLWDLAHLRRELWTGGETKARERDVREALQLVADALADRRTGTHGRPTPGGVLRRRRDDAQLVSLLARIAAGAVGELQRAKVRKEDTFDNYVRALRRIGFWAAVDQSFSFDPEAPDARASRLAYTRHRLEHDLFFPTLDHPERPFFGAVVTAMVTALLGGEVDPAIFGGSGEADKRVTARSLAIRALRKLHPENLEIPKR